MFPWSETRTETSRGPCGLRQVTHQFCFPSCAMRAVSGSCVSAVGILRETCRQRGSLKSCQEWGIAWRWGPSLGAPAGMTGSCLHPLHPHPGFRWTPSLASRGTCDFMCLENFAATPPVFWSSHASFLFPGRNCLLVQSHLFPLEINFFFFFYLPERLEIWEGRKQKADNPDAKGLFLPLIFEGA